MKQWICVDEGNPPPGRYWTRCDTSRKTDRHGLVTITYTQCWLNFDGIQWDGELSHYYAERVAIQSVVRQ